MKFKFLILILLLILVGCVKEVQEERTIEDVLSENNDFKDYSRDFNNSFEREFNPVVKEKVKLNDSVIKERNESLIAGEVLAPFSVMYDNLSLSEETYEVWMYDQNETSRGIVFLVDMDAEEIIKFYAHIMVSVDENLEVSKK